MLVAGLATWMRWLLRHEIFYGSLIGDQVWEELGAFLQRSWEHPSGTDIRIVRTFVDAGYEPGRIYRFCQAMQAFGVWASKGVGGADRAVVGRPSKNNPARCNVFPLSQHNQNDAFHPIEEHGTRSGFHPHRRLGRR